eukprot:TRINITY_DN18132_c0_g1_i1.p1 TRINITY_DN18132_c0_g1~~TRINITY_DN18132_c0_g1_i1.p1  ORF type:complete len:466 (+),score=96.29 TRINITY_DN18132_c0_g1_i1:78-1400(+)
MCAVHDERLKFLCENDSAIICRDCFDPLSNGHHVGHTIAAALPALEKKHIELQEASKVKLKHLAWQENAVADYLRKAEESETEFNQLIAALSAQREKTCKEARAFLRESSRLSSRIQKASSQARPALERFIEYFKIDAVNHQKLLHSVDERKAIKFTEETCIQITQIISKLQRHFEQFDMKSCCLAPSKSTVCVVSSGQSGELQITGIAENGERCDGKIADFEVIFNPADDVKHELSATPDQKGMWRITYGLAKPRDQKCVVKYLGTELSGSPLTICSEVENCQLEWDSSFVTNSRYGQLYEFNGAEAVKTHQEKSIAIIRSKTPLPVSNEATLQWEVKCILSRPGDFHVGVTSSNYDYSQSWLQEAKNTSVFLQKSCHLSFKLDCVTRTLTIQEASEGISAKNRALSTLKTYQYSKSELESGLYFAAAIRNVGSSIEFQ